LFTPASALNIKRNPQRAKVDMNGIKSRKFIQALLAELALVGALVACLADAALRPYLPHVVVGLVAVAVGYGAVNAWQARSYSDHGQPPGLEP
jgi:hypothetical protein